MGLLQDHALGRDGQFYSVTESTKGTFVRPIAGHAMRMLSVELPAALGQERTARRDHRQGRADVERIAGKEALPWSVTGYMIPSGVAGTAPDADALYEAAFGVGGASGSTYVYSPSDSQSPVTVSLTHWIRTYMLSLAGAWVDEFMISGQGADPIRVKFAGGALHRYRTGSSTLSAAMSSSANAFVQTGEEEPFDANGIVAVGSDTNSGAGYLISSVAWTSTITVVDYSVGGTDTITLASRTDKGPMTVTLTEGTDFNAATDNGTTATNIANAIDALDHYSASAAGSVVTVVAIGAIKYLAASGSDANAWTVTDAKRITIESSISASSGATFYPYAPTPSTAGTVIAGISGALTLDSVSMPVTAFEVSIKNNVKVEDDRVFSALPTDAINGYVDVTAKLSLRLRRDMVRFLGHNAWRPMALSITMGDSTVPGHYATFSIPRFELARVPQSIPEADEVTIDIEGVGLAADVSPSSTANKACSLTFY